MQANILRGPRFPLHQTAAVHQLSLFILLAMLVLAGLSTPSHGQYAASLQGTVADPTGAVIPDVTITLTDKETNRTLTAQSNGSGTYTIGALQPSSYKVSVT